MDEPGQPCSTTEPFHANKAGTTTMASTPTAPTAEIHEARDGNTRIAKGTFGEIYLGLHLERRRLVAIKTIGGSCCSEIRVLQELPESPNICPIRSIYPNRQGFGAGTLTCLALDYAPVDLQAALEWRRRQRSCQPLTQPILKRLSRDLFLGMAHVHNHGWVHGDIKPGNILVSGRGVLQLTDFGLAQKLATSAASQSTTQTVLPKALCTLAYRPPELLLGGTELSGAVDVYSAGCVVAELFNDGRQPLFPGRTVLEQVRLVFSFLWRYSLNEEVDSEATLVWLDTLPDWAHIKSTVAPPTSKTDSTDADVSWEVLVPRIKETTGLLDLLRQTVVLDPQQRLTSSAALTSSILEAMETDDNEYKTRQAAQQLLVPPSLAEPIILSPTLQDIPKNTNVVVDWSVADAQILELASARRVLFSNSEVWGKEPRTKSAV